MIKVVKSPSNHYKTDCGDIMCEMIQNGSSEYLVAEEGTGTDKVIPLACAHPNPWVACAMFDINTKPIQLMYNCPYTRYEHFAMLPIALLVNGDVDVYKNVNYHSPDYLLDWEFHTQLWKNRRLDIQPVQQVLLGSGYQRGCSSYDGHGSLEKRRVMLDNGDALWVAFWEWFNK